VKYETIRTPDGEISVRVGGRLLHSSYGPRREAERAFERFVLERRARTVIVIGEGVPYFSRILAKAHPSLRVLALTFGTTTLRHDEGPLFVRIPLDDPAISEVRRVVRGALSPVEAAQVQAFLWPPAEQCIPKWVETVRTGVIEALRDGHSQLATIASFGQLWIKNALKRTVFLSHRWDPVIHSDTVISVSAGPSATDHLKELLTKKSSIALTAVSSSVSALEAHGFKPDILFHTDAGFWAKRYRRPIPTVVTLSSSVVPVGPFTLEAPHTPEILVRTGWIGEDLAGDTREWTAVGEYPTVAGTMLAYLDKLAPDVPVLLAGFDLCSRDLYTHARPHENDSYIDRIASRLRPETTVRAQRSGAVSDPAPLQWPNGSRAFRSDALKTFLEPMETLIDDLGRRKVISHLAPSPVWSTDLDRRHGAPRTADGIHTISQAAVKPPVTFQQSDRPPLAQRKNHGINALKGWWDELSERTDRAEMLLLHLAPVETLAAARGERPAEDAVKAARTVVDTCLNWVRHGWVRHGWVRHG